MLTPLWHHCLIPRAECTISRFLLDLFECNDTCGCGPGCGNRVVQREPYNKRLPCYLFRTAGMQWGVRCSKPIPAGTVIGDYLGERKTEEEAITTEEDVWNDEYMFVVNSGSIYSQDMPELADVVGDVQMTEEDGTIRPCKSVDEALQVWPRVTIDALACGSLARFINHSVSIHNLLLQNLC